jgi:hypothetical protein
MCHREPGALCPLVASKLTAVATVKVRSLALCLAVTISVTVCLIPAVETPVMALSLNHAKGLSQVLDIPNSCRVSIFGTSVVPETCPTIVGGAQCRERVSTYSKQLNEFFS